LRHRVGVPRKRVQWNNKPTTEFGDLRECVCLAACVSEAECLSDRHGRLARGELPKWSDLISRQLCNEFIKCRVSASRTDIWKCRIERHRFTIVTDQDGLVPVFRFTDDRKRRRQQSCRECSEDRNSNELIHRLLLRVES